MRWIFYEDSDLLVPLVYYKEQNFLPLMGVFDSNINIYFGFPYEPGDMMPLLTTREVGRSIPVTVNSKGVQ